MRDYLLFKLAAPLASFGGLAVGERRPSEDRPTKSQIIGLVASALGVPRADEAGQQSLGASLGYAVRVDAAGGLASDYHTAQAAKDPSIRRWERANGPLGTRCDELACDDVKTVLSMREYRTGVVATAVLWLRDGASTTLDVIADKLRHPTFALYLGRKAFPLMLPCRPLVVTASTSVELALADYDLAYPRELLAHLGMRLDRTSWLYLDSDAELSPNAGRRIATRRDVPESRAKWRFGLRDEIVVSLERSEAGS